MRGIKFRGKLKEAFGDNAGNIVIPKGKWIYGGIVFDTDRVWIDVPYRGNLIVDKETVGQYTGLKDKNGKEIYEGDIVEATYFGKAIIGSINYWLGCFIIENSSVSDNQIFVFDNVEVIGNIYENLELLEDK